MSEQTVKNILDFFFSETEFLEKLKQRALSALPVLHFSQKAKIYMTNVPTSKAGYKLREPTKEITLQDTNTSLWSFFRLQAP